MYERHIPGGDLSGQDHFDSIGRQIEQGGESLIQFTTGDAAGCGIYKGLKVIQQQYHLTQRKCFQKCLHFRSNTGFCIPIHLTQPLGHIIRQQAGKVSI